MTGVRAVITGESTLAFRRFELPGALSGSQVLVRLERTIISAGTELANYTGLEPDTRIAGRWCCYPWTPGYGGIGRVVRTGPDVRGLKRGQRVYGTFNHATHHLVDCSRELCVPVPAGLEPTAAAFVRMGNVALTAFQRSFTSPGDTVAVIGLGLVGNLAGQFFAREGRRVFGLDVSAQRRALAERTGFTAAVDPAGLPVEGVRERLLQATGGVWPRVVVDAVGDSRIVEQAVHLAEFNGQVVLLGTPRAPYETDCTGMLKLAHFRGISLQGALEWTIPLLKGSGAGSSTEGNAEAILGMVQDGSLQVGPLCSHVLPPATLGQAYEGLLNQKDAYLGVVLDWESHPAPSPEREATTARRPRRAVLRPAPVAAA
jgi:2-desacetyl-2-hydroxyethyl bacteriochlorophyllide A dehydrogenase